MINIYFKQTKDFIQKFMPSADKISKLGINLYNYFIIFILTIIIILILNFVNINNKFFLLGFLYTLVLSEFYNDNYKLSNSKILKYLQISCTLIALLYSIYFTLNYIFGDINIFDIIECDSTGNKKKGILDTINHASDTLGESTDKASKAMNDFGKYFANATLNISNAIVGGSIAHGSAKLLYNFPMLATKKVAIQAIAVGFGMAVNTTLSIAHINLILHII
jgi:hypothetical protein